VEPKVGDEDVSFLALFQFVGFVALQARDGRIMPSRLVVGVELGLGIEVNENQPLI
jgi:hypothetical protein